MALQDILQAITSEADTRIADAQAQHKQRMKQMKEDHEAALAAALRQVQQQKEQRKHEMRQRAEGHASMMARHAILERKQELLDEFYDDVVDALAALPAPALEKFLGHCLSKIEDKGVIHPAKGQEAIIKKLAPKQCTIGESIQSKGGFRFVGEHQDSDFTFEFLVHEILRYSTQIETAHHLFSA